MQIKYVCALKNCGTRGEDEILKTAQCAVLSSEVSAAHYTRSRGARKRRFSLRRLREKPLKSRKERSDGIAIVTKVNRVNFAGASKTTLL